MRRVDALAERAAEDGTERDCQPSRNSARMPLHTKTTGDLYPAGRRPFRRSANPKGVVCSVHFSEEDRAARGRSPRRSSAARLPRDHSHRRSVV
jgi:hypothetical protein